LCHLDIEDDLENALRAIQDTAEDAQASVSLMCTYYTVLSVNDMSVIN